MKKLLAFVFTILSLISVNLFAVEIRNVVDNGNGEYTVQRISRGVAHTFHRAVDGTWTELIDADLAPVQVTESFARMLNLELQAYILGKNSQQSTPQPAAPQPQREEQPGQDGGQDDDMDIVPSVGDDPGSAAELAGELERKRSRGDESVVLEDDAAAGAPQEKRKNAEYAEIGRLYNAIRSRQQHQAVPAPTGPVAGARQPQQAAGQPAGQSEFDWTPYRQALEENSHNKCLVM